MSQADSRPVYDCLSRFARLVRRRARRERRLRFRAAGAAARKSPRRKSSRRSLDCSGRALPRRGARPRRCGGWPRRPRGISTADRPLRRVPGGPLFRDVLSAAGLGMIGESLAGRFGLTGGSAWRSAGRKPPARSAGPSARTRSRCSSRATGSSGPTARSSASRRQAGSASRLKMLGLEEGPHAPGRNRMARDGVSPFTRPSPSAPPGSSAARS